MPERGTKENDMLTIKEAKVGKKYSIKKIKAVVLIVRELKPEELKKQGKEPGAKIVKNLVTENELLLNGNYKLDAELSDKEAQELLDQNETVQQNKAAQDAAYADQKARKAKKKAAKAESGEAPAEGAKPEKKEKKAPQPKREGPGKCALIDELIKENKHTVDQIVAQVAEKLSITDVDELKKLKSTTMVRPTHLKKAGYTIHQVKGGVLGATK